MKRPTHPLAVYRTQDGLWHFRCAHCIRMNGFGTWRAAYESARWHLASDHGVMPARVDARIGVRA